MLVAVRGRAGPWVLSTRACLSAGGHALVAPRLGPELIKPPRALEPDRWPPPEPARGGAVGSHRWFLSPSPSVTHRQCRVLSPAGTPGLPWQITTAGWLGATDASSWSPAAPVWNRGAAAGLCSPRGSGRPHRRPAPPRPCACLPLAPAKRGRDPRLPHLHAPPLLRKFTYLISFQHAVQGGHRKQLQVRGRAVLTPSGPLSSASCPGGRLRRRRPRATPAPLWTPCMHFPRSPWHPAGACAAVPARAAGRAPADLAPKRRARERAGAAGSAGIRLMPPAALGYIETSLGAKCP